MSDLNGSKPIIVSATLALAAGAVLRPGEHFLVGLAPDFNDDGIWIEPPVVVNAADLPYTFSKTVPSAVVGQPLKSWGNRPNLIVVPVCKPDAQGKYVQQPHTVTYTASSEQAFRVGMRRGKEGYYMSPTFAHDDAHIDPPSGSGVMVAPLQPGYQNQYPLTHIATFACLADDEQ